MDSLTHTVLGACMGEAIAGRQMGKKAMLIGALAHNFPDIDVIFNFFTTQASSLLTHRGITHSIFCNVIFSFLFATILKKYIKNDSMSYKRWLAMVSSGLFTHILIDAFTAYGTGWFEPFNNFRVTFNAMFILDPLFMIALLIPALVLAVAKKTSEQRTKWANAALIVSGLYICMCIFNKFYAKSRIEKDLKAQNVQQDEYMFTPTPLNNLLYYIVARKDEACYIGYYSVFDKAPTIKYEVFNRNDSLLDPVRNDDEIKKLIRFSKGYYYIHAEDSALMFSDIRFGQLGGWYKENSPFVFNFNVAKTADNRVALQQGRFKSFDPDVMSKLVERIKGNK